MNKEAAFKEIINSQSYHVFFYPFQWDEIGSLKEAEDEIIKYNNRQKHCWKKIMPSNASTISKKLSDTFSGRMLYKTYQYFNNASRDLVFGRDNLALKYELCNKDNTPIDGTMYIFFENEKLEKMELLLRLLSVKLDIYEFGVGIISYEVVYQEKDENISLESLLKNINFINEKGRRLYPPFFLDKPKNSQPNDENQSHVSHLTADKISIQFKEDEEMLSQNFSEVDNKLKTRIENGRIKIENILPEYVEKLIPFMEKQKIETVTDDRMFCCSLIMNDVASNNVKGYCDGECNGFVEELYMFAYVENSISCTSIPMRKKILQKSVYDRWVEYGTIYAATHHSFMSIMEDVSQDPENKPVFLIENFVELYVPLVKIVLVQRAELLVFLKRAAELASNSKSSVMNYRKRLEENNRFKHDYSRFLNEFMLPEVSSEEQAVDLYNLIQEQLYINQVRESLTVQTQILYDITQSLVAHQEQKSNYDLQVLVGAISFVGICYGFVQIIGAFKETECLASFIAGCPLSIQIVILFCLFLLVVSCIWIFSKMWKDRKESK